MMLLLLLLVEDEPQYALHSLRSLKKQNGKRRNTKYRKRRNTKYRKRSRLTHLQTSLRTYTIL
jgi:hypothetical protein